LQRAFRAGASRARAALRWRADTDFDQELATLLTRIRRSRLALLPLVALASALALGLAACGGDDDEDARKQLDEAFSKPIKSANVTVDVEAKLDGIPLVGALKARLTGPFQSNGTDELPSLDFDVAITGVGQGLEAGIVSTPDNLFVILEGQAYEAGRDAVEDADKNLRKQREESETDGDSLKELGINPSNWVTDAKDEGEQQIGGVETDHISAKVDVGRLLDDGNKLVEQAPDVDSLGVQTPDKLTEGQKDELAKFVKNPTIDVYVGKDDGIVRRVSFDVEIDVPEDQQGGLRGFKGGDFALSVEFKDVGKPVKITPPTNAKPIDELGQQLLGGGLGGFGGGGGSETPKPPDRDSGSSGSDAGGSSSGSSSSGTTPNLGSSPQTKPEDAEKFQRYLECVREAGSDQDKITSCTRSLQ